MYCCQVMAHLLEHGAIVDALDSAGATPLMFAVNGDHGDAAGLLVDYGANVRFFFIRVSDVFAIRQRTSTGSTKHTDLPTMACSRFTVSFLTWSRNVYASHQPSSAVTAEITLVSCTDTTEAL